MELIHIPSHHVDFAWADGASSLAESCVDECTADQLKMLISKDERKLVRMECDGKKVGWAVFRVDALPNMRVLFITNMVGHGSRFERFYSRLTDLAQNLGCSRIRFAAKPAQERLYRIKLKAAPVYQVMEVKVC